MNGLKSHVKSVLCVLDFLTDKMGSQKVQNTGRKKLHLMKSCVIYVYSCTVCSFPPGALTELQIKFLGFHLILLCLVSVFA